jgi:hypothetical protein
MSPIKREPTTGWLIVIMTFTVFGAALPMVVMGIVMGNASPQNAVLFYLVVSTVVSVIVNLCFLVYPLFHRP